MPPPPSLHLTFAARTDTGQVRPHNEDSIVVRAEHGLAILADGMGGYSAGEVASSIATSVIGQTVEQQLRKPRWRRAPGADAMPQLLTTAVELANSAILATAQRQPEYAGMGTTLVTALFEPERVSIAHVGDSRAYRIRQGQIEQLTHDHSLLQEQLDAGLISVEAARFAEHKNLVTRALGVEQPLEVEVHQHQSAAGDLYLLCSDGLSDMLPDQRIAELVQAFTDSAQPDTDSLESCAEALVAAANEEGGRDNISVILITVNTVAAADAVANIDANANADTDANADPGTHVANANAATHAAHRLFQKIIYWIK
jgi:PPM family protein phosphatase